MPALALAVPLAISPISASTFELPKLFLLKSGVVLAFLGLAASAAVDLGALRTPVGRWALVYLGLNALATLGSIEPRMALLGTAVHSQGLLVLALSLVYFFLAARWLRAAPALATFAAGLTLAATASGLLGIAQSFGFDPFGWATLIDDGRLAVGTIGNANSLAELLVMILPLTAWLAWRGRGLRRDLALWSVAIQLVTIALTQARTAWIALLLQAILVGPLVLCARRRATVPGRLLALTPQLVGLTSAVVLLALPTLVEPSEAAVSRLLHRGQPLAIRHDLWRSGLAMIADRPLLGWGPSTVELAYPAYRSPAVDALDNTVGQDDDLHNLPIGLAVNAGLPGLAAFLAFDVALVRLLLGGVFGPAAGDSNPDRRAVALALLWTWNGYILLFTFGRPHVTTDWLAWVVAGSALGMFGAVPAAARRIPVGLRLAATLCGLALLAEAASEIAADAAYARAIGLSRAAPRERVVWLERAVSLRPFEPDYRHELGASLVELARSTNDVATFERASAELEQASALLNQRDATVLDDLAHAVLALEAVSSRPTEAPLRYAERAIALDPLNPLVYAEAADLAIALNRPDAAGVYWEAARARARSSDAFQRVGEVALELGDPTAARRALRQAAEAEWRPRFLAERYRAWGDGAMLAGAPEEAVEAYRRALDYDAGEAATRTKLGEALTRGGLPLR